MQKPNNISIILFCSFLFLLFAFSANAQEGQNPFDLEHRLKEKKVQITEKESTTDENPFDLSTKEQSIKSSQTKDSTTETRNNPFDKNVISDEGPSAEENKNNSTPPQEKEKESGFVFWAILLMMVFLALEITLFKSLLNTVYRAFTNDNILKLLHREQRDIISFPYLLLYLFFFVNFGIFSFLIFNYFGYVPRSLNILLYCIGGVGLLFLLKHILLKIVEIIFPVEKEIKQYSFSLVIFSSMLGFALVPFNIIIAFASDTFAQIALYGGLLTVLGITIFCILRGLFLASKYLSFHKFHFFMYLCTVEIAPVLVVVKLLLLKAGIH